VLRQICNAFWSGKKVSGAEKLKALVVTGGVPRYLQEIDPSPTAERNIHRLCFIVPFERLFER
jgi:uncharacterized protein